MEREVALEEKEALVALEVKGALAGKETLVEKVALAGKATLVTLMEKT